MNTDMAELNTALATREYAPDLAPRFVMPLDELKRQIDELERFKREIMVPGVDYGVIPGTPKPTLLKPGAEKLSLAFGLAPIFESANCVENWEAGFFHYDERCVLTSRRMGQVVASANGSANSKEPRYRWRNSGGSCPECGRDVKRRRDGGAWCPRDDGGCGANFTAAEAPRRERKENSEPYELVNTIKKMAQKRALVAAILIATGGSGTWTQDVEDLPNEAGETVVIEGTARPVQAGTAAPAAARPAPRPAQPAAAARGPRQDTPKPTETPCDVCGRKVESEALLKDSLAKFKLPFCTQHMNEALDGLKPEAATV